MKLLMNEGSPFARKVRIFAREKGLADKIEEEATSVSPISVNDALAHENPLAKIPVLQLGDGRRLYDSSVICEYLDTLHDGRKSFPAHGAERFQTLCMQALCDGMLEAAVLCRYESVLRPADLRWDRWFEGQKAKVFGGLGVLEAGAGAWADKFEIEQICAVCTVGYLDYRFFEWEWRREHPALADWHSKALLRGSVCATLPPGPGK